MRLTLVLVAARFLFAAVTLAASFFFAAEVVGVPPLSVATESLRAFVERFDDLIPLIADAVKTSH